MFEDEFMRLALAWRAAFRDSSPSVHNMLIRSAAFRRFCDEVVGWELEQHWDETMPERWVRFVWETDHARGT